MVVEIDKLINEFSSLPERGDFLPVDALRLENGKEIFRHSVVAAVPTS